MKHHITLSGTHTGPVNITRELEQRGIRVAATDEVIVTVQPDFCIDRSAQQHAPGQLSVISAVCGGGGAGGKPWI